MYGGGVFVEVGAADRHGLRRRKRKIHILL